MKALSLFANVGLAETYLSSIGIDVVIANEIDEQRARFYKHLNPTCDVIIGDITNPKVFGEIVTKAKEANVEFLMATPPCQGMSIAGHNSKYDERNSLIKYAIDVVDAVNPKFVFFENVPQQMVTPIISQGVEMKIPEYIRRRLGNRYTFNAEQITNAMYYGVPQRRERAIFLLVRNDLNLQWNFPQYEAPINLEVAFKGIPDLWPDIKEKAYQHMLPANTPEALAFHKWHKPPKHVWRNVECMLHTPTGNTAFDNPIYYPKKTNGERVKGYDTTYHRLFWDKPAATVTMWNGILGSQNNVHPGRLWKIDEKGEKLYTNPRVLTIYELLIVSSLPIDWNIPDWANEQLIRFVIGEGIPPLMVKKIVEPILR
jgi:DNA (cytosine-5)-methyltransferase 1